uniref:Uncharacterized protein n=1 Tax=Vespula pensylvanica TaxID=30213 RepID=A0A834PFX2_VESPE|nr:hypothetical protein H0235_001532 [Vespula pensylvanica]
MSLVQLPMTNTKRKSRRKEEEFQALSVLGMTHTPMSPNGLHISGRKALAYAVVFEDLGTSRHGMEDPREILRDIPPLCFYDSKKLPRLTVSLRLPFPPTCYVQETYN